MEIGSRRSRAALARAASWAVLSAGLLAGALLLADPAHAARAADIDRKVDAAMEQLLSSHDAARALAREARAILVFPNIVKGGFVFGGQYGDGALREGGRTTGYYRSLAVSYGLQAGVQAFGYALFLMNDKALDYLRKSHGFELGVGPSLVVLDQGAAGALTTTTARKDIYAVFFDQKGLMAGIGLQGTKITPIHPK
jgi:lipid-binding SYLF domain-containing protein